MSAWLVTDTHISAMTQAAAEHGIIPADKRMELGKRMKQNNLLSLHYRYRDPAPPEDFSEIELVLTTVEAPLRPSVIVDGFRCWSYQCMEYDGFDQRIEYLHLVDLMKVLTEKYTINKTDVWGIDSWDQVIDQSQMGEQLAIDG